MLKRVGEFEVKMGRSFIADIIKMLEEEPSKVQLFLTSPCEKCGNPGILHNRLCVYCDRGLEMETGDSESGRWYKDWWASKK